MGNNDLIQLAKSLELCDERGLVAKCVIAYTGAHQAANIMFGRTQGAGQDGFIGIFKDQVVCFEANIMGTKPTKERFRISFEFITAHELKKGFLGLNNQLTISTEKDFFKLYFMGKRRPMFEQINQAIS